MEKLLIALFPIIGCFYKPSIKKYVLLAMGIALFFLLAVWVSPYSYSIAWIDDLLILIVLSGIWSFFISTINKKETIHTVSALLTFALGFVITFIVFANAFTGTNEVLKHWEKDSYHVNYIESRGFSGRPLYYYELKKTKCWDLLETPLDRHELREAGDTLCDTQLLDHSINRLVHFDRCKGVIHLPN